MINKYLKFMKKEKLHEVVFVKTTDNDEKAAEYAAHLAITCYNHLHLKTPDNEDETVKTIICSPEVLAATMQIAYQEKYKLKEKNSELIKYLTDEEYNDIP